MKRALFSSSAITAFKLFKIRERSMKRALFSSSAITAFKLFKIGSLFFSSLSSFVLTLLFFSFTKIKRSTTARMTKIEATGNASTLSTLPSPGRVTYTSIRRARRIVPRIVAIPPIVLITPLASLLKSPGTMSGINATTGPLTACLEMLSMNIVITRRIRLSYAVIGTRAKNIALIGRSVMI